ncbi:MAG: hypothetical protein QXF17_06085 [Ignisphaera sp.]
MRKRSRRRMMMMKKNKHDNRKSMIREAVISSPLSLLADVFRRWLEKNCKAIGEYTAERINESAEVILYMLSQCKNVTQDDAAWSALWVYTLLAWLVSARHIIDQHGRFRVVYDEEQIVKEGLDVDSTKDLIRAIEINLVTLPDVSDDDMDSLQ